MTGLSKSQVSVMAAELDEMVIGFRNRKLGSGPYAFVWIDALSSEGAARDRGDLTWPLPLRLMRSR